MRSRETGMKRFVLTVAIGGIAALWAPGALAASAGEISAEGAPAILRIGSEPRDSSSLPSVRSIRYIVRPAPAKAAKGTAPAPRPTEAPSVMAAMPPTAAPPETPSTKGSARGLRSRA